MHTDDYLAALGRDGRGLAAAAEHDLDAPVPACPGWDVAELVAHVGMVHRWVTEMVTRRAAERLSRRDLPPPPARDELLGWYGAGLDRLLAVLAGTPADEPVWNWTVRPHVAGFWPRRMAHETAVHRWDAEAAVGTPPPVAPPELAADGIAELLDTWLPTRVAGAPDADLGGTLHLHCTDVAGEWLVSVDAGRVDVRPEHGTGDAAARGPASDLLLYTWNRVPRSALEVVGDAAIVDRWPAVVGVS